MAVVDPGLVCRHCQGANHLIRGEGVTVCRDCVYELGRVAKDPKDIDDRVLVELSKRHRDVVELGTDKNRAMAWRWTARWPA